MPTEWTILHQVSSGDGYVVSHRKVGLLKAGKPVDAGRFATREEADAYVVGQMGRDDSVTHLEPQTA